MKSIIISCNDKNGIFTGKTDCIDICIHNDMAKLINIKYGFKIDWKDNKLKIGCCEVEYKSQRTFPGSWCAEEFFMEDKQILKLIKYLKNSKSWEVEECNLYFDGLWENI